MSTQKTRSNYREVIVVALAGGVREIESMDPQPSRRTLRRACDELRRLRKGDVADDIERFMLGGRRHGRIGPSIGETRVYKAQQTKGDPFLRIPVTILGGIKGTVFKVSYGHEKIVIERPAGVDK